MSGLSARWRASSVLPPLGALPTAPAAARGYVRGTLAVWRLGELSDTVELVVSELAANGVNASAGPEGHPAYVNGRMPVIRVGLFAGTSVLVAEVWDQAGGVPARKSAGEADESGRGLDMVHELTQARWGWHPASAGPGKCVWAEFPISGPVPADGRRPHDGAGSERHAGQHEGRWQPVPGRWRSGPQSDLEVTWKGH